MNNMNGNRVLDTMKHFLRSLFFWNAPTQGASFWLMLFFVCGGQWFTLYQLPWLSD